MKFSRLQDRLQFANLSPAQQIALSFFGVIFVGTILLSLPISNHPNQAATVLDHLFTATSAVCVTGLTTIVVVEQYTLFGQVIILGLMQIGGLGLMTLIAAFLIFLSGKLTLTDKMALSEAVNRTDFKDFLKFIRNIIKYTIVFEGFGVLLLSFVFVPQFGWGEGLFKSLFIAVSAFCNAGLDILGSVSLQAYVNNPLVNFTVAALIVMGGLGFGVWFELSRASKRIFKPNQGWHRIIREVKVHARIVLITTFILIISGTALILMLEAGNPNSLQPLPPFSQLMAATFQSITLRTAGFSTLIIGMFRPATLLVMMVFMFIGGSPGGTAGGIKTTTVAILILMIVAELRSQKNIVVFGRTIEREVFRKAFIVAFILLMTLLVGIVALLAVEPFSFMDLAFEATSAIATVGLSTGITSSLSSAGKLIIIALMYLGRIGPLTLMLSVGRHPKMSKANDLTYPSANILIG
jgi:trk system potassium uptake protein